MTAWNELPTREPLFFALLQCPNVTMLMRSIFIEAHAHNVTKESKARGEKNSREQKMVCPPHPSVTDLSG